MSEMTRRQALRLAGCGALAAAPLLASPAHAASAPAGKQYAGADLADWNTVVGDGLYTAPGEGPVTLADIAGLSITGPTANCKPTFTGAGSWRTTSRTGGSPKTAACSSSTRSSAASGCPTCRRRAEHGPERADPGGRAVCLGRQERPSRLRAGLQWSLNPWDRFGEWRCWTDVGGGRWQAVGALTPDTAWHRLRLVLDCPRQTTALLIDGLHYPCCFTGTPKPADWGPEIAAGVQVEIISVYPGPDGNGATHKADFKDW